MGRETDTSKARIFLFSGEDTYTAFGEARRWRERFLEKYGPHTVEELRLSELREKSRLFDFIAQIGAVSLFRSEKLIVIWDAELLAEEDVEHLGAVLKHLRDDVFVLLVAEGVTVTAESVLQEMLPKGLFDRRSFVLPRGSDFVQWIVREVSDRGGRIGAAEARVLAEALGKDQGERVRSTKGWITREIYNLHQTANEIEKLVLRTQGRSISPDDIAELVEAPQQLKGFGAANALLKRDTREATHHIENELVSTQEPDAPLRILGLLTETVRAQLLVRLLLAQNLSDAGIAKKLGWTSGRVFMQKRQGQSFDSEELARLIRTLAGMGERFLRDSPDPLLEFGSLLVSVQEGKKML